MQENMSVVCGSCDRINQFPENGLGSVMACGNCNKELFPSEPLLVNFKQLDKHLDNTGMPIIVDFGAPWCGPCRSFELTYNRFCESARGKLRILKVNTDESPDIATEFNIRSLPTIGIYGGGNELARNMGGMGLADLEGWIIKVLT